jgi:hypothetical protein
LDAFRGDENYPDDFTVLTCKIHNHWGFCLVL